ASESQVDMIAHRLGMDPYELRIKNLKKLGEPFVPGESGIDSDPAEGLDAVAGELGWAGAEVDVDPETGKVTVLQLVASGDVGKAINTLVCRGQDEGAAVMGLGQALFEEMRYDGGVLLNGEALDYRVPMAEDLPVRFVSITQEQGHGPGPFGAKGAGEGAMVPVAAAIANAVHDATGARITELPLSPERVFNALRAV
ncbi:MAG: molybdopterin cofactor-binding domain-containing protein, partial [Actinomadura sp.]